MGYFDDIDADGSVRPQPGTRPSSTSTLAQPPLSRAAYGPDVLGGNTYDTPLQAPQNAQVDPSLTTPRRVSGNGAQMGPPGGATGIPVEDRPQGVGLAPGPISSAVQSIPTQAIDPGVKSDLFVANARADANRARDNLSDQQAYQQNNLGNQRAQASYDAQTAKRNAEVSRFVAQNGADMVLAPENSGYDGQRRAIVEAANNDAATAREAGGRVGIIDNAIAGAQNRPYVAENALSQQEINRAQIAGKAGVTADVDLQHKQLSLEQQKQLYSLQQELASATDPAKQKILQNKIATLNGSKRTDGAGKFIQIDVDTGQFETDVMGNKKPIYKKGVFNTETGEIASGAPDQKPADPVAGLKALAPDKVIELAKKAIADGASRDEVNKRLKAAGHKEI